MMSQQRGILQRKLPRKIIIVMNSFEELKKLVPVD